MARPEVSIYWGMDLSHVEATLPDSETGTSSPNETA